MKLLKFEKFCHYENLLSIPVLSSYEAMMIVCLICLA